MVYLRASREDIAQGIIHRRVLLNTEVGRAKIKGIGSERLRKDRALSYIIRYQSSANVEDLEAFNQLGRRWIAVWNDADMYNNLINVERYLGQQKNARALREEARRLYPEDRRFSS